MSRFGTRLEASDRSGNQRLPSPWINSYPTGVLSFPLRILNFGEKRMSRYASDTTAVPLPKSGMNLKSKYFQRRPVSVGRNFRIVNVLMIGLVESRSNRPSV